MTDEQQVQGGGQAGGDQAGVPADAQSSEQLASDFKKDELKTAADVQGVDVKAGDTKADIAEKLVQAGGRNPVHMDNYARRSDDDALLGSRVKILEGEHAGQEGAFHHVETSGADGYPELVVVKLFDTAYTHEFVTEPFSNIRTVRLDLVL